MSIFDEKISRKPVMYPWAQSYIEAMWDGHWTAKGFTFQSDVHDFKTKLTEDEKLCITRCLSTISQVEISVKKFWSRLADNLPHPELIDLGYTMASIEVIHNFSYEKLLDVLQLNDIFEENLKLDIIKNRVKYLGKYNKRIYADNKQQYVYSIILFTLFVENVSLFSQFFIILWFNRYKNVLKDTAQQVNFTIAEEALHALAGIKIIQTIREEHPELFTKELEDRVRSEASDAFEAESNIVDWMVGDIEEEFLSKVILKEYIKNRINESLTQIGFNKVFEVDAEIIEKTTWMEEEEKGGKLVDFFHKRPTEYAKNTQSFSEEDLF